jgi:transposase-like protein
MTRQPDPHYRHRFPAEIISRADWFYHMFSLSLRYVELLLAEHGNPGFIEDTIDDEMAAPEPQFSES